MSTPVCGESGAVISDSGLYRYRLWRRVSDDNDSRLLFIMLNPSTADASVDDPTIRRCLGFARELGFGILEVVNLFAYRTSSPAELWSHAGNIVGPDNDKHIAEAAEKADMIIGGWGAASNASMRALAVNKIVGRRIQALALTKSGAPRHPLYLKSGLTPVAWSP